MKPYEVDRVQPKSGTITGLFVTLEKASVVNGLYEVRYTCMSMSSFKISVNIED